MSNKVQAEKMKNIIYFYPVGHESHYEPGHPERPERVEAIVNGLKSAGWWDGFRKVDPLDIDSDLLNTVHQERYLMQLEQACSQGMHLDADTFTTPHSWGLALNAAFGACAVADRVWTGKAESGFALTRPPGHHATRDRGMGFCLLNNVALATEYLLKRVGLASHSRNVEKVAIIDLDLHHGNGTQDIFYGRDDVFYISTHQSPLYPGSGRLEEMGVGAGEGTTLNLPLPPGTGDEGFLACMQGIILPMLNRYNPQILLVSFGFDPHWRDPLGHLMLSANGYRELINNLKSWAVENCEGKIALFLEGGYDLEAGAACAQAVVSALLGEAWDDPLGPAQRPEGNSWRGIYERALALWKL